MKENSKIKFKFYKDPNKDKNTGWSNIHCSKINTNNSNSNESIQVCKINQKLDNIENTLTKLNSLNIKEKEAKKKEEEKKLQLILKSKNTLNTDYYNIKLLNYSELPRKMLGFYFTMQTYCSFPPIIDLNEFYQIYRTNQIIPDYLLSAIVSNACLNSPNPQLKENNWIYSDYYYNLSLSQFNLINNEANIFMIQSLLILSLIDDSLNRPLQKANRVTTAVKLGLILEMDKVDEFNELTKPSKLKDIPYLTIRKLWYFIKYWDAQTSKVLNTPTMIRNKFDEPEYYHHPKPLTELPLIKSSKLTLPEDYIEMMDIYMNFGNLVISENEVLDFELRTASKEIKFLTCIEHLVKIENFLKFKIPSNLSYSPDCLILENLKIYPLTRIKYYFYQKVLDIGLQTVQFSLSQNISDLELLLKFKDNFRVFSGRLIGLIEDQLFALIKYADDNEEDQQSTYPILLNINNLLSLGHLYIDFINHLTCININNIKKITNLITLLELEFENFIKLIRLLGAYWKDSKLILNSVLRKYNKII